MALAGSSVWPRAASLVGGAMVRSGTIILWNSVASIDVNSVPMVMCLVSDIELRRFLVVKPSRGAEIMVFGSFNGAIWRETARSH